MADRQRARVNLVAAALLEKLRVIGRDGSQAWLKRVQTAEMFKGVADAQAPRPSLFLEVTDVEPANDTASTTYREHAVFVVHCFDEDPLDPSGSIHDFMADMVKVVKLNAYFAELGPGGWIRGWTRKAKVEQVEGKSGLAEGFFVINASFITTDDDT